MTMTHPLSQSQTGIYLTCMNTRGDVNYNMDFLYELTDDIDLPRLAAALDKVIETHPYVKSRLVVTDSGEMAFEDCSEEEFHTPILDAGDLAEVRGRIGKDYDLMHDRLFRLEIYRTKHGAYLYQGFHHMIFDGISHATFREDVEKAYAGEALEPEETDGFQIAEREIAARQSAIYEEAKAWYAQEYGGVGEIDSLPLPDIFGEEEPQYGKYSEPLNIDRPKTDALCERAGVRESVVFSAAFGITLSKFTCQDEVACVTGFHGRTDKATRRSLTMTVRTLPLRFNLQQTPTVAELLQATAEQTRMTRRYDMYSFVDMSNDLGLNADVSFVYHGSIRGNDLHLNGSTQKVTEILTNTPGFKFVGMLVYKYDVPYFEVEYLSNRYSREFVDSFKRTFETVVNEMCVKESVADIECCDEEGIAQLDRFNTLNKVPQTMPENETIVSLFQRQASLQPDHTAVVFGDKRYTYRELDEQTDRIASLILSTLNSQLSTLNSEPVISIIIHRNEWMVLASLTALKAGCAYQPLDPSYPQDRLNFMVKDANAVLLIADEDLRPIVNEYQGEVLLTKDLLHLPSLTAEANSSLFTLHSSLSPSSLFTLLYTSGSTGVPKGVMLEHRNLIAFNLFFSRYIDVGPDSRVAAYASFGFDANMMDIFCTLMSGATLHIIDEDMRLDLEALHRYFEREGITNCFMTTQVGVQYLELYPQSSSLRHLVIAGEKMRAVKLEGLTYHIHNGYGPSETACGCALHEVKHWEPNIPIGTPSDLCNLYIVDRYGHRLPPGAPGELIICGPQVTRGYLNQPEKTAEAFFTFNGQRAYHSGDIVRYRQNGDIEFVGRRDGMVKIRGFRIELGEVEAVIRNFEGINDVTVQAFDAPDGGKFLAAYVVTDGSPLDIHALNAFISSQKPPYMVPAVTMQIEKIPLTVNQKVDKRALPKPEMKNLDSVSESAPMNLMEQELHAMIAAIIGQTNFGITTPLNYVGLTSITFIRLAVQVNKKYGVALDAKSLSKTFTLQDIENEIWKHVMDKEPVATNEASAKQAQGMSVVTSVPLSYAQTGVYMDCMKNPTSTLYNTPICLTFPVETDAEALKKAAIKAVENHPALFVQFTTDESGVVQVMGDMKTPVEVKGYTMSEEEMLTFRHGFVRPFNLEKDRLFRLATIHTDKALYLCCDFHHLVCDGYSYDLFIQEICNLMEGKEIEPEMCSYMQFVMEQKAAEKDEAFAEAAEFFKQRLGDVEEVTELAPDLTNPLTQGENGRVCAPLVWHDAEHLAKQLGVKPSAVLLSAVFYCLSRFSGNDHVCITTISNGRSNLKVSNTMGMFVNTLAISSKIGSQSVQEFLRESAETFEQTLVHENYPFSLVAADYGLKADIMFAYQIGVLSDYRVSGKMVQAGPITELNVPKFKIAFYITDEGGEPVVAIEYDNGQYSKAMMQSLAQSVSNVVSVFAAAADKPLRSISLIDSAGISLLDSFNQTAVDYDDTQTIVSLFRRQAAETPDNLAVIYHDVHLTYKEVDEKTDTIAALVQSKIGIATGEESLEPVVSILIPRGEWMVLASLGVLKAGCAYQPLDPSYPSERLNFMMQDADAKLLIAEETLLDKVSDYKGPVLLTKDLLNNPVSQLSTIHYPLSPSSLFILLYTSGSTGTPKGCQLEHRNLVCFCHWYQRYYDLKPGDKVAAYASYGFDACMMDMYPALTTGAAVVIVGDDIRLNLPDLNAYFDKEGVTHAFMTTQVGCQFAMSCDNHSLRHLSVGGEKILPLTPPKSYQLHNGYGPTECTIFTTTYQQTEFEQNAPIGKPVDNMQLYIVDKDMNRLPLGAAGEMLVTGPQVSRGYLNLPERTAQTYIQWNGKRCYRTGDVVRYLADGNIQFVGRSDGQVKIRGFRIELGEVESVIRDFEGIKDVTVQALDAPDGGKFLAAYVVTDGSPLDIHALNAFISSQKPPYMIPAVTMQIDRIPLTVNQKVDKKALPRPQVSAATSEGDFVPLKGHLEETIAQCIAETLSIEPATISARDTFSMLGGTSIKAIKLNTLLRDKNIEIPMEHLLRQNDIRILALIADYASRGEYVEKCIALQPAQLRMLHQYLKHPDHPTDAYCVMLDIDSTVTEEILRRAIDTIAAKHTAITSAIAYVGTDQPMQVYLNCRQVPLYIIDADDEQEAVAKMDDLRIIVLHSVCSLQLEPLLQFALCRIGGASAYLMVSCYTIIAEMWKISSWVQELFSLLHAECGGENVANWKYILTTSLEAMLPDEREDWSKEQHNGNDGWHDEGLTAACDDSTDNYKILTEKPGGKQLVFVHTGNTGSDAYLALADGLKDFCSFAVIDQWNLYHRDDIKHGIPEIARKYVEVLREHHPHGPYYLGGWCYGGLIAYEMACQLKEMGEQVEELFMFDVHVIRKPVFKDMFIKQSGDAMRKYFEHSPLFESLIKRGLIDALVANSLQVNFDMVQYQPKPYDGEVIYFKAITPALGLKGRAAEYFEEMNSKRAGGFEKYLHQHKLHIVDIKQEHDNLMNEASLSIEVPYMKQYL